MHLTIGRHPIQYTRHEAKTFFPNPGICGLVLGQSTSPKLLRGLRHHGHLDKHRIDSAWWTSLPQWLSARGSKMASFWDSRNWKADLRISSNSLCARGTDNEWLKTCAIWVACISFRGCLPEMPARKRFTKRCRKADRSKLKPSTLQFNSI